MIKLFRNKAIVRTLSAQLLAGIVLQLLAPLHSYALTGGPSQPEVAGFQQASITDMVDPFTGDFSYNISLMQVGEYPVNLVYHSGQGLDEEASWVGLGWSLNTGAITRDLRGLPDDFKGEKVEKNFHYKPNQTFGITASLGNELVGTHLGDQDQPKTDKDKKTEIDSTALGKLKPSFGIFWNSYTGYGTEVGINPALSSGDKNKEWTGRLGITSNSESGLTINPTVSYKQRKKEDDNGISRSTTNSLSLPYNSRSGFKGVVYGSERAKLQKNRSVKRAGVGMTQAFVAPTYTPSTQMPTLNANLSVKVKVGLANWGFHGHLALSGYYSGQYLLETSKQNDSYGYLYTGNGNNDEMALLDYNRSGSFVMGPDHTDMPVTSYTYDVFNVSGQGVGGSFRPHRKDVGVMFNDYTANKSAGINFPDFETGAASGIHVGVNSDVNYSEVNNGRWDTDNDAFGVLRASNSGDEPYYFKEVGECTPSDEADFNNTINGTGAIKLKLAPRSLTALKTFMTIDDSGNETEIDFSSLDENNPLQRQSRQRRNTLMSTLTAQQAAQYGVNEKIAYYSFNTPGNLHTTQAGELSRTSHTAHHLSEITVTKPDGNRYVYGVPAYNNYQEEASFSVTAAACQKMENISYSGTDNSVKNAKGKDHYYNSVKTPGYAHAFMLSAVLSPDYADKTGDGPTADDYGDYTRFNYSKIDHYKWRNPYTTSEQVANYNPGLRSVDYDETANYLYGEKELWYVQSIESRDFVAYFYTSDREDGLEALGADGGKGSVTTKRLNRIELYAKSDLTQNGSNAVPIKTVFFEYNYSLCPGIPNTTSTEGGGKLTLKKVYFTYGKSERSASRAYTFFYCSKNTAADCTTDNSALNNPAYKEKSYDRWGNYKQNELTKPIRPSDYPYTSQDADGKKAAWAWSLTAIRLPSGGVMRIGYESDDYAYVQDKRAMQMVNVLGSSKSKPDLLSDSTGLSSAASYNDCYQGSGESNVSTRVAELYEDDLASNITGINKSPMEYMVIRLPKTVGSYDELANRYFRDDHREEMKYLFFRYAVQMDRDDAVGKFENIQGYIPGSDIEYGLCENLGRSSSSAPYLYAWVRLKPVQLGDYVPEGNANPISHVAWNFIRLNLPNLMTGADKTPGDVSALNAGEIFTSLASQGVELLQFFTGVYYNMRQRNIAQQFDTQNSYLRLYSPASKKLGGGSRVASITINDQFRSMLDAFATPYGVDYNAYSNTEYGQEYTYLTKDAQGNTISSGVAAYEPMIGGEENPFKMPDQVINKSHVWAPSEEHTTELPYAECLYPAASVGYSKVTTANVKYTAATKTATGSVVQEFYTAKDFPTRASRTPLSMQRNAPIPLLTFLKTIGEDRAAASQGFAVELNDMHGKPKSTKVYAESNPLTPIRSEQHYYHCSADGRLSNEATTVDKNGTVKNDRTIGLDIDLVADMTEETSTTHNGGIEGNLDMFIAVTLPIALPAILPGYTREKTQVRTAVMTKLVNRCGLLDSTVVTENGSRVTTLNMAYDDETGEVLLTRTNNLYNQYVYNFTYPGHFAYDGMRQAYIHTGQEAPLLSVLANPSSYVRPGDMISLLGQPAWVMSTYPSLVAIDRYGKKINLSRVPRVAELAKEKVTVLRPAQHNMQGTPIGQVTCLDNPVYGNKLLFSRVINASAVEFSEEWPVFCECDALPGSSFNPYIAGRKGNLRPKKNYLVLTGREQSRVNGNLTPARDGKFTGFSPFWNPGLSGFSKNDNGWTYASEITVYNPHGFELENRDALGRYSAAVYGYNFRIPVSVASNMQYREIGFDGFEDYVFYPCSDMHFGFKRALDAGDGSMRHLSDGDGLSSHIEISSTQSHTGRYSLKIKKGGDSVKLRRTLIECNPSSNR